MKQKYSVKGMTCSACESHVYNSVCKLPGVSNVEVNLLTNSMNVEFDEHQTNDTLIIKAVKDGGYQASLFEEGLIDSDELVGLKKRLVYCFIALGLLMYVSMSAMFNYPIPSFIKDSSYTNIIFQVIFLIPILILKKEYFINGFKNLIHFDPTMDSLIALGAGAAIVYSVYSVVLTLTGTMMEMHLVHNVYFESAGMIITLISFGKYLEARSKKKTTDAISKLLELAPDTACRINDGKEEIVKISQLMINDKVLVKANETIPVDGKIIQGFSSVDESMITGESLPIEKGVDSLVIGGTNNLQGSFIYQVTKTVEDSTLAKIIELVEEASSSKAPMTRAIDKVVKYFVPTVIIIALLTFGYWMMVGKGLNFAITSAIAVLVISCPCALGLATPVAIMVSTGVGATNGILIKSASVLENENNIDVVVFDKTGTLTQGKARVSDVYSDSLSNEEVIRIIASLEKGSSHVLADAFIQKAKELNVELVEITDFESLSGLGIKGNVLDQDYLVGNLRMIKENKIDFSDYQDQINDYVAKGKTLVFLAKQNKLVGLVSIFDDIKLTSKQAIQRLKEMKIKTVMLTGDLKAAAKAINQQLELDEVIAEVLPQDKESVIKRLQEQGNNVMMVGDGINDAPALVRSDVGVAIGKGNDIAIDAADVILMKDDMRDIVSSIELSKKTILNIKENLFWAFIYNIIGIPIAAGVFYNLFGLRLDAMIGSLCMSLSSVCVVSNALRLKRFKPYYKKENKKVKKEIMIDGMMCAMCKKHVEEALNSLANTNATVNLEAKKAIVETELDDSVLQGVIEKAGYKVVGIENV
ncbi:heavy metal translocating P-type ATPase [Thomasclavelia cocleata]|jgi:Cu+-exporting ATPase|uniref:heavy metal translocating P-type ATPase n=1 Tax=Thomasclavelia cocleata TaxID=69824 RepID=UPI00242EB4DF|nr:heavy metal translocating P-type ATPase [Thomasclavelia cocleata]MCI9630144.1 heavy metal translocating P-type ATPase [Thomasclavelia cocleata]